MKSSLFPSLGFVLCVLCGKIFSQIDTITRDTVSPFVDMVHLEHNGDDVNLDRLGIVENKILYGSQRIDGNDVMIVDLNDLLNPTLSGTIPRTGSTEEE